MSCYLTIPRMNKSVKNLLRISSVFYKRTNVSIYTCPIHCLRGGQARNFDAPKGVTKLDSFNETNNADSLLYELKTYNNVEDIICAVKSNSHKITKQHVLAAITSLYNIYTADKYTKLNLSSNEFSPLLKMLYANIKLMDVDEAVKTLKIIFQLNKGKNSDRSLIMQSLLQIIRSGINDLSLKNIFILSKLIEKFKPTPLSEALKVALPIIFDVRISKELDRSDELMLVKALEFASHFECNTTTIKIILEPLSNMVLKLNVTQACSVYLSLTYLKEAKQFEDLFNHILHNTLTVLKDKRNHIPRHKIPFLIRRTAVVEIALSSKTSGHKQYCSVYDDALIDNCIKSLLSEELSIQQLQLVMSNLNRMRHVNFQILDYLASQFYILHVDSISPELYQMTAQEILNGITIADYKPKDWDNIQMRIIKSVSKYVEAKQDVNNMLYNAIYFARLGYYDPTILEIVFTSKYEGSIPLALLHLYQYVKTFYPEYTGPFPSSEILWKCREYGHKSTTTLKAALEQGFGDARYVQHNLKTKLGHIIDHAVAMRKGGFPIAISSGVDIDRSTPTDIESLVVPSDSQIILILNLPREAYPRNCNRLKGTWVQYIKCLEVSTGYSVVSINSSQWEKLPSYEQISYLMQAIKFKCIDHSWDVHCS